jgi:hypothetical protein
MYEHRSDPVAPRAVFLRRLARSGGMGLIAIAVSLLVGMLGYHSIEGLSWIDAFLNAAMLLGGMGPLEHERNTAGKLFEGFYAIYCGLAVISVAGVMLAPVIHRFLHKLHRQSPHE